MKYIRKLFSKAVAVTFTLVPSLMAASLIIPTSHASPPDYWLGNWGLDIGACTFVGSGESCNICGTLTVFTQNEDAFSGQVLWQTESGIVARIVHGTDLNWHLVMGDTVAGDPSVPFFLYEEDDPRQYYNYHFGDVRELLGEQLNGRFSMWRLNPGQQVNCQ